jgi:hypothetical protein
MGTTPNPTPPPPKKKEIEKSSIKDCRALHAGQILFGSRIMSVEVTHYIFCPVCLDAFSLIIITKFLHCGHRLCLACARVSIHLFFIYLFDLKRHFDSFVNKYSFLNIHSSAFSWISCPLCRKVTDTDDPSSLTADSELLRLLMEWQTQERRSLI